MIWFDRQEMSQIKVNMSGTHGEWSRGSSDLDSGRVQLKEVLENIQKINVQIEINNTHLAKLKKNKCRSWRY